MRLSRYSAAFVGAMAAAFMTACGGAEDPLGGPYGGTMAAIGPNGGNVGALSDQTDAAGDDASTRGANSSGGTMGTGSGDDAGEDSASPGSDDASGPSSSGGNTVPSSQKGSATSGIDAGQPNGGRSNGGGSSGASGASSSSGGASGASSGSSGMSGGGSTTPPAPTWSKVFSEYLTGGTIGNCTACHGEMGSAPGAYSWLSGRGYISGTASPLVTPSSCLSWFGGNMPPGGSRSSASAQSDMRAWAAAGAKNN